jgi:hypothetical protein
MPDARTRRADEGRPMIPCSSFSPRRKGSGHLHRAARSRLGEHIQLSGALLRCKMILFLVADLAE